MIGRLFFLGWIFFTPFIASAKNSSFCLLSSDKDKAVTLSASSFQSLDSLMNSYINKGFFPGAQLVIGGENGVYYSQNYGFLDYSKNERVTDSTIYDLSSLTKIFSTTLAIMKLVSDDKLEIESEIATILPQYDTTLFASVTVEQLLAHTSGFEPVVWVAGRLVKSCDDKIEYVSRKKSSTNPYKFGDYSYICKDIVFDKEYISTQKNRDNYQISKELFLENSFKNIVDSMVIAAYKAKNRHLLKYSDLNYYMLQKIVEKVENKPLSKVVEPIYNQLGICSIGYKPLEWSSRANIAPTEFNVAFRRDTLKGFVHDDMAAAMGLECGHAGLFASAKGLAPICQMFLKDGRYSNKQIINSRVLNKFTKARVYPTGGVRALGFDKQNPKSSRYSAIGYGHSGYSGTYFWVEPRDNFYLIILTNRVCPTRTNNKYTPKVREDIWALVKELLDK